MGMVLATKPTKAIALVAPPLTQTDSGSGPTPETSVAKSEDMDPAQVEKAYYGHWRRVNRRHWRRVRRRVYRRHYTTKEIMRASPRHSRQAFQADRQCGDMGKRRALAALQPTRAPSHRRRRTP